MSGFFPAGGSGGAGSSSLVSKQGPLGAPAATFDFTGIAATFNHIQIIAILRDSVPGGSALVTFNGDNGTNYDFNKLSSTGATATSANSTSDTRVTGSAEGSTDGANVASMLEIYVPFYSLTTFFKTGYVRTYRDLSGVPAFETFAFTWKNTAAINRVTFAATSTYIAGCAACLYGIT